MNTTMEQISLCGQCSGCADVRPRTKQQIDWIRVLRLTAAFLVAAVLTYFGIAYSNELVNQPMAPEIPFFVSN